MSEWNKPSSGDKPVVKSKKPSALRGIVAGSIVVLAAVGVYLVFFTMDVKSPASDTKRRDASAIKEVRPNVATYADKEKSEEGVDVGKRGMDAARSSLPEPLQTDTGRVARVKGASTNRVFSTGIERLLSMVFATEVGDMPPPLPRLHRNSEVSLATDLLLLNEALDSDDVRVRFRKEQVAFAKKEMLAFIKDGGDYNEFLTYYHRQLVKAARTRKDCQRALNRFCSEEGVDPEMARKYRDKLNERLDADGIKHVSLPDDMEEAVGQGQEENK